MSSIKQLFNSPIKALLWCFWLPIYIINNFYEIPNESPSNPLPFGASLLITISRFLSGILVIIYLFNKRRNAIKFEELSKKTQFKVIIIGIIIGIPLYYVFFLLGVIALIIDTFFVLFTFGDVIEEYFSKIFKNVGSIAISGYWMVYLVYLGGFMYGIIILFTQQVLIPFLNIWPFFIIPIVIIQKRASSKAELKQFPLARTVALFLIIAFFYSDYTMYQISVSASIAIGSSIPPGLFSWIYQNVIPENPTIELSQLLKLIFAFLFLLIGVGKQIKEDVLDTDNKKEQSKLPMAENNLILNKLLCVFIWLNISQQMEISGLDQLGTILSFLMIFILPLMFYMAVSKFIKEK